MTKQYDMWNHPQGTGLLLITGHVPEEQYLIPELDHFPIPTKALENTDEFISYLLQVISMKPRHETIFHLCLAFKNYEKTVYKAPEDYSSGR